MHVVEKVTVEGPVARLVRRQVELRAATRLQDYRVLERLTIGRRAIDQLEEMTVQVNGVRHHRVVDELHAHALVIGETDRLV